MYFNPKITIWPFLARMSYILPITILRYWNISINQSLGLPYDSLVKKDILLFFWPFNRPLEKAVWIFLIISVLHSPDALIVAEQGYLYILKSFFVTLEVSIIYILSISGSLNTVLWISPHSLSIKWPKMTYFGENIKFRRVVTSLSVIYRAEIHLAHSLVITNNRKISRNRFCKIECSYIHEKRETCLFLLVQGLVSPYVVTYRFWLNKIT